MAFVALRLRCAEFLSHTHTPREPGNHSLSDYICVVPNRLFVQGESFDVEGKRNSERRVLLAPV